MRNGYFINYFTFQFFVPTAETNEYWFYFFKNLFSFICMHTHLWPVCNVFSYMCAHACGGWRWMSDFFLRHHCLLRQALSAEPKSLLFGQSSEPVYLGDLSLSLKCWNYRWLPCLSGFYVGSVNLDSGLQYFGIKHFLSELSPLSCLFEAESHVAQAHLQLLFPQPSSPTCWQ